MIFFRGYPEMKRKVAICSVGNDSPTKKVRIATKGNFAIAEKVGVAFQKEEPKKQEMEDITIVL